MASISRKTADWVQKGLISASQAQDIMAFEQSRKSYFSLFSIILFLGFFSVACGVVAVVSSNWYTIPGAVKIAGLFVFLGAAALVLARVRDKHPAGFEGGLFFYMMLLFAAIGLVGQVYHLKSDTYKAFLFWSALAFPLLFLTRKVLLGYIWEFIFAAAFSCSPWGRDFWEFFFRTLFPSQLCLSFLCAALFFVLLRVGKARVFVAPLRIFTAFFALFSLMFGEYAYSVFKYRTAWTPLLFFIAAAGFAVYVWKYAPFSRSEKQAVLGVTGLYVLFFLFPAFKSANYFFQLTILIGFVFTAYRFGGEKTARLLAGVTALRMLIAFFSLFGSLLYTGIGLIVSGLVILGMAYGCLRADAYLKLNVAGKGKNDE